MRTIFLLIIGLVVFFDNSFAQEMSKKEQRKQAAIERQANNHKLLEDRLWIMNADQLRDKTAGTFPMQPSTNFMMVDGEKTYIQFNFAMLPGWNGINEVLFTGNITKYDLKELNGKKTISLRIHSQGAVQGFVNVLVQVTSDSYAEVTITTAQGERLQLYGPFGSPDNVNYFKSFFEN